MPNEQAPKDEADLEDKLVAAAWAAAETARSLAERPGNPENIRASAEAALALTRAYKELADTRLARGR